MPHNLIMLAIGEVIVLAACTTAIYWKVIYRRLTGQRRELQRVGWEELKLIHPDVDSELDRLWQYLR